MMQEFGFEEPTFSVEMAMQMLQGQMSFLGIMWIEAEVSEFKIYRGAHWYFTLKDIQNERASMKCAMFRSHNTGSQRPSVGDRILVQGEFRLNRGQAQLTVYKLQKMQQKGAHEQHLEALRRKLEAEGLLDETTKRSLPRFPRRIGIVTSRESAALQDVLDVLRERLPTAEYILADTMTEGIAAAPQVVNALEQLQFQGNCDVIIVTRGGGSRESLMAFNDEAVIRCIANCDVPVVCAIGHQTDFTLSEFAADLRASTPTKAAQEVAKISEQEIAHLLMGVRSRMQDVLRVRIHQQRSILELMQIRSPLVHLQNQQEQLQQTRQRMKSLLQTRFRRTRQDLEQTVKYLDSLGPRKVLERGYTMLLQGDNPISSITEVTIGDRLNVELADGRIAVQVVSDEPESEDLQLSLPFV